MRISDCSSDVCSSDLTLTYNEAIYLDGLLWDVQQMEVYRGPQSTLQGRNAIGGVVAIKTADPTFDWQGKVRGVIGGDKTRQISGAAGGPVVAGGLAYRQIGRGAWRARGCRSGEDWGVSGISKKKRRT